MKRNWALLAPSELSTVEYLMNMVLDLESWRAYTVVIFLALHFGLFFFLQCHIYIGVALCVQSL